MTREEKCQECKRMMPNVGNWREPNGVRRLCGGCKVRITLANPRIRESLQRDIEHAMTVSIEQSREESGK